MLEDVSCFYFLGDVAISWNAKVLAAPSATAPGTIRVWHIADDSDPAELHKLKLTPSSQNHMGEIAEGCAFSRDGDILVASYRVVTPDKVSDWFKFASPFQNVIRVWDPLLGTVKQTVQYGPEDGFSLYHLGSMDISPDGETIAAVVGTTGDRFKPEIITWKLQ